MTTSLKCRQPVYNLFTDLDLPRLAAKYVLSFIWGTQISRKIKSWLWTNLYSLLLDGQQFWLNSLWCRATTFFVILLLFVIFWYQLFQVNPFLMAFKNNNNKKWLVTGYSCLSDQRIKVRLVCPIALLVNVVYTPSIKSIWLVIEFFSFRLQITCFFRRKIPFFRIIVLQTLPVLH